MGWTQKEIEVINQVLDLLHKHNINYMEDLEKIILEHKKFTEAYNKIKETHIIPKVEENIDEA